MTDFPSVFSADGEAVKFLSRYKSSLLKRLSLTRMKELFEAVDLAFYLMALGRNDDALRAISFICDHSEFNGNYNIWTPVGYALCLKARLCRLGGDLASGRSAIERVRVHPFQVLHGPETVKKEILELPVALEAAYQDSSLKWSCHKLARTLDKVCFYQETGLAGFTQAVWYSPELLEVVMKDGLSKLNQRLQ